MDKKLEAKRGYVYEFDDGKSDKVRYVLVVSDASRKFDKLVNTIMLGTVSYGRDVVVIRDENIGGEKYVHCGSITYTKREYLKKCVYKLPDSDMIAVEETILRELGMHYYLK